MPHSLIRRAAYEPDPAQGPWVETHQVLRFGDTWRDELMCLYRRRWAAAPNLPVRSLNTLAQAIAPGLIATGRHTGSATGPSAPWLYARHEVPSDVVMALFFTWVRTLAPTQGAEEELDRVLQALEDNAPVWSTESVNLLKSHMSEGGTAEPERRLYSLLAEWLAARLAARPYRTTRFRVVSRDQGTELVSWPPQSYTSQGRTWYYSAVVTITVQTAPFDTAFRVHISTHIRRWATTEGVRPRPGRGATVLLDVPVPWPDFETPRSRLVPNIMQYDPKRSQLAWRAQGPATLLGDLDLVRAYPEPTELAAHPERYLLGHKGLAAGIVYSHGMGSHQVGPGLMPGERAELDAWVEEGVSPYLRRVPDLVRAFPTSKPALLRELSPRDLREDPEKYTQNQRDRITARRAAIRAALGGAPLEIEIFWRQAKTRDQLISDLHELLGFTPEGAILAAHDQSWRVGELDVRLRSVRLGSLGTPLYLPEGSRSDALNHAIRARREEVLAYLGDNFRDDGSAISRLAFVEIGKREFYPSRDADPKYALRLGFAHAGRLTQFIQDADHAEAPLEIRARSACLDGFRQLGADILPSHRGGPHIPGDLQYVGLWMVRRSTAGPTRQAARRLIAIRLRPDEAEFPVCGWDENKSEWVPYPRLLLTLASETQPYNASSEPATEEEESVHEQLGRAIQQRIRSLLYEVRDRPTLLLVNSGNLRKAWPSLSNGRLVKDMLQFGGDRRQRIAAYGADLRLVLIRDRNSREETAQWYALGGAAEPGFASGLWVARNAGPDNRVFISTTDGPPILRRLGRGLRKFFPDSQWPGAPGKTAWNPQALELTVLGCLSQEALNDAQRDDVAPDNPATWAAVTHQSRFHNDHQPLSHPLAQHLAALAEEYVLPSRETSD
jgi:hypothetical protein